MSKENNKVDINKHEIDIDTLFKQNVNDLSAIKELYRKLQELEERFLQIKYIDSTLAYKLKKEYEKFKKEYEKFKKIILNENIQIKLTNDIEKIISQLDTCAKKDDVTRISSGTPLFASSVIDMTDVTRNYVNTTDGYLYRYNGNTFEKTTVLYQATGVEDKLIDEIREKLNVDLGTFLTGRKSVNLVDRTKETTGFLGSAGSINTNETYCTTDFIEVNEGKSYIGTYAKNYFLCTFDKDKNMVGTRVYTSGNIAIDVDLDSGIKYVRFSYENTIKNLQFQEGTKLTAYEEYGKSFIVEDSISQDLKNVISQKSSNVIKVSKENGDYNSLSLAIDNSKDGDVIIVYPAIYDNEKIVNRDKDISIIGIDKTKCIIQNSFDVYGEDPITMTQGYIANLTIKALASDEYIYQDGVSECYCMHIDTSGDNSNLLVENCDFYSWHWACVGIGLHQDQKIKFKGCEMYNMQDDVSNRRYAALFHQRNGNNVDGQELIFENCIMKSKAGKTLNYQKVGNNSNMKLTMYKNILFDEVNGIDCLNGFTRSGENLDVSGSLKLSNDSFGNNVTTLNAN